MEEKMGDLNELLKSTEEKLRTDIDAKYDDNMKNIKKYASEVGDHSNNILQSNNRLDKVDPTQTKIYGGIHLGFSTKILILCRIFTKILTLFRVKM